MTEDEETAWASLPEKLRLALLDHARRELGLADRPLTLRQIAEVVGVGKSTVDNRCQAALLRMRRRAEDLGT